MVRSGIIKIMVVLFLGAFLVTGCVTVKSSGLFAAPGYKGGTITLKNIQDSLDNFNVLFTGPSEQTPTALLFDPKQDDKQLIGDRWEEVTDLNNVDDMIAFIKSFTHFYPGLFAIIGPGNQVFGYVLSPGRLGVSTRTVDDKTIYVYQINSPLYLGK